LLLLKSFNRTGNVSAFSFFAKFVNHITLLKDLGKSFASKEELDNNKRSRSAILRIAQRTTKDVE
jgi:16S rRNA C1402 N4-methylase RsmH